MTKKTLYLLHGLCASSHVWEAFTKLKFINERFDICVLQYPLHLEKSSFDILIEYFQKQIESYGQKNGILCGHSLGAHLGIRLGEIFPELDLILIQCSPALDLQDLFSYFKPSRALECLYQEKWSGQEQELIESHLFSSFGSGKLRLENESWEFLRRDLAQDLNHGIYKNEIEMLNRRSSKTALLISGGDKLIETDRVFYRLAELVPSLKILQTQGSGHYAFYDSLNEWFGTDVKKCFDF